MLGRAGRFTALAVCSTVALLTPPLTADAALRQPVVVSQKPSGKTPQVIDSRGINAAVDSFTQLGPKMYAGGTFYKVQDHNQNAFARRNLFSFNAHTGDVKNFAPRVNGSVEALATDGTSLYVGGNFTRINGVRRQGLAKLNPVTGAVRRHFRPGFQTGQVSDIQLFHGRLIVAGSFGKQLVALNPRTGANTGYVRMHISGRVTNRFGNANSGPTEVSRFAISPGGYRMVAIGNFTSVNGHTRYRAFIVDLPERGAKLDPWYYPALRHACAGVRIPDQLRDVDFSPQGGYFVVVATGFVPQRKYRLTSSGAPRNTDICDAAARFNTMVASPKKPVWVNYTGGDSLYSVSATGPAVYVQGHERWLNNPKGVNSWGGPGPVVYRPGIGAINPTTGRALAWNPTKSRGIGGKVLYATTTGLWVGSDGRYFGKDSSGQFLVHDGIAFCPVN